MRYVMQLLIIICFSFLGEVLHALLPLPFPASIYGILLLYMALELKLVKTKHIKEVSTTLIIAMPVMFVPAAVGLMETWGDVKESWLQLLLIIVASTFAVMAITGWVTQGVVRWKKKKIETKNFGDGKADE